MAHYGVWARSLSCQRFGNRCNTRGPELDKELLGNVEVWGREGFLGYSDDRMKRESDPSSDLLVEQSGFDCREA